MSKYQYMYLKCKSDYIWTSCQTSSFCGSTSEIKTIMVNLKVKIFTMKPLLICYWALIVYINEKPKWYLALGIQEKNNTVYKYQYLGI